MEAGKQPSKVEFYEENRSDSDEGESGDDNQFASTHSECDGKHWFSVSRKALPFFEMLHDECEERFLQYLQANKDSAIIKLKEELTKCRKIQEAYSVITSSGDKDYGLLGMIIAQFVKSKQKQQLHRLDLRPSRASYSLRSTLRQQSKQQSTQLRVSSTVTTLREAIKTEKEDIVKAACTSLGSDTLSLLTVKELKGLLKVFNKPLSGLKPDLIDRAQDAIAALSKVHD